VTVPDVTSAKQPDIYKYVLRGTNITWPKVWLKKPKWGQHAYQEGHKICWKEAMVLQIERNTTYRI
jgi:hypothetical protein